MWPNLPNLIDPLNVVNVCAKTTYLTMSLLLTFVSITSDKLFTSHNSVVSKSIHTYMHIVFICNWLLNRCVCFHELCNWSDPFKQAFSFICSRLCILYQLYCIVVEVLCCCYWLSLCLVLSVRAMWLVEKAECFVPVFRLAVKIFSKVT